jgi:hypothetical protein
VGKGTVSEPVPEVIPTEILGFVSPMKELFLFETKVKMTSKIEGWMQNVEVNMQETVGKI